MEQKLGFMRNPLVLLAKLAHNSCDPRRPKNSRVAI